MSFSVLGINHKTAPIDVRENLVFKDEDHDRILYELKRHPLINGCFLISTCNRTEVYFTFDQKNSELVHKNIKKWFANFHQISLESIEVFLYFHQENDAILHLMRVCSGLDSLVLGETQILRQIKSAYFNAKKNQTTNSELSRIMQRAFYVAKRVRTETGISENSISVAFTVSLLVQKYLQNQKESLSLMLIGAGETIELVARYLSLQNFKNVIIANRTEKNALAIADYFKQTEIIALPSIPNYLPKVDIIISSTASPFPIIGKGLVERTLKMTQQKPLFFADIAVPRDVEPEVNTLKNITLYSIDDLQEIIKSHVEQRKIAAEEAENLIQNELVFFQKQLKAQKSSKVIQNYHSDAKKIAQITFKKALREIENGKNIEESLQKMSNLLTKRLLHSSTKLLRESESKNAADFLLDELNKQKQKLKI